MEIILCNPEIPQNTGNIARTCALTGSSLTLVGPLGFSLANRHLKRAGLDYWPLLDVRQADRLEEVLKAPFYFFSSKATKFYSAITFEPEAQLIFGSESQGLPATFWEKYPEHFYSIPMKYPGRSLNLSNAVAVVLYEGLRQLDFIKTPLPSCAEHRDP